MGLYVQLNDHASTIQGSLDFDILTSFSDMDMLDFQEWIIRHVQPSFAIYNSSHDELFISFPYPELAIDYYITIIDKICEIQQRLDDLEESCGVTCTINVM